MKTQHNQIKIPARFEPDTQFEISPLTFRAFLESEFEILKEKLLKEILSGESDHRIATALRQAANEAASLAWVTPFPQLFFPELFQEKAQIARVRLQKQVSILRRSRALSAIAA